MADNFFKISYPKELGTELAAKLQAGSQQSYVFKIENRVGYIIQAQVSRELKNAASAGWFKGNAIQEIQIGIGQSAEYKLEIDLPADALTGNYALILEVVDLANPDETVTRSEPITLIVEPAPELKIPLWLMIAGFVLLLAIIGGGVAAYLYSQQPPSGEIHIAYTQNVPPSRLQLRYPSSNSSVENPQRPLTEAADYERFLNEQAQIVQYTEYQPSWSPDGCSLVYGASIDVGRYFLSPNETLYDLRALLSIPADEMETLATEALTYPALDEFLAENEGYALAAKESRNNPYLALAPENTALVSYYQRTLARVSPEFSEQFYRRVAGLVYNNLSRGTLYGLFQLDMTQALDSSERIQLLSWARLDGDARYIPTNPAWQTIDGTQWIAFEFAQDIVRQDAPAYIALYRFGGDVAPSLYLLQIPEMRSVDGLYFDREPVWWTDGNRHGLYFVSRNDLNSEGQAQAQIYRIELDFTSILASTSRINPTEAIAVMELDYTRVETLTPTFEAAEDSTATPTAVPTLTPTATLFFIPLHATPNPAATLSAELTAEALELIPTLTSFSNLSVSSSQNLSSNSVNDSSPLFIDATTLIFVSDRDGLLPNESQHLYRMDLSEITNPVATRLTDSDNSILELQPDYDEVGEQLIFTRQTGRAPQLYTMDWRDSNEPLRLTENNLRLDSAPAWQPQICPNFVSPFTEAQE